MQSKAFSDKKEIEELKTLYQRRPNERGSALVMVLLVIMHTIDQTLAIKTQ